MWLKGTMTKGQRLSFTAGVPVLPRLKSAHMSVVVIGPGLPPLSTAHAAKVPQSVKDSIPQGQGAILTESPQDQSTCAHVHSAEMGKSSSVKDGRCHFHEEYAGSHSWVLIDNNVSTVEAGVHHLAVFTPTQINAKVWFACCDWPEDFQAQYTIPAANCPYCGTKATNPSWSDLFYEQKAMVPHGGFPAADSCASSTKPPTAPTTAQCPALPDTTPEQQSESCKLGCSKGECHSHNVLGVCNYTVQWITPSAKMGNAEVKTLRIFAGESVKYTSLGHAFPHNLVAMETKAKLESCDFSAKTVVGDVGQLKMGKVIKYTKPGTYNYACEIGNHCQQGQKITVVVQDASDGMRCHDHEVTPSAAAVKKCPPSTVKASIVNSSAYGSAKGQCSELCTTEAAMQWMAGAKKGPCQDQGYGEMIEEKQVQPAGSPAKMAVTIMAKPLMLVLVWCRHTRSAAELMELA
jgi:plastocyanin